MSNDELIVENIFKTYNYNCSNKRNEFFKKYNLDKDKKLLGLLKSDKSKIKLPLDIISKEYNIISISTIELYTIKIEDIDLIYLISFSDEFISDKKILIS